MSNGTPQPSLPLEPELIQGDEYLLPDLFQHPGVSPTLVSRAPNVQVYNPQGQNQGLVGVYRTPSQKRQVAKQRVRFARSQPVYIGTPPASLPTQVTNPQPAVSEFPQIDVTQPVAPLSTPEVAPIITQAQVVTTQPQVSANITQPVATCVQPQVSVSVSEQLQLTPTPDPTEPTLHGLDDNVLYSLDAVTFSQIQQVELDHLYSQDFGLGTLEPAKDVDAIPLDEIPSIGRDELLNVVYADQAARIPLQGPSQISIAHNALSNAPQISPTTILPVQPFTQPFVQSCAQPSVQPSSAQPSSAQPSPGQQSVTIPSGMDENATRAFLRGALPSVSILGDDLDKAAANLNAAKPPPVPKRKRATKRRRDGDQGGEVGAVSNARQPRKRAKVNDEQGLTKEEELRRRRALRNRESARRSRQRNKNRFLEMEKSLASLSTENAALNDLVQAFLPDNGKAE